MRPRSRYDISLHAHHIPHIILIFTCIYPSFSSSTYQVPRTIESTRLSDETTVTPGDSEVFGDEKDDEFAVHYSNEKVRIYMYAVLLKQSIQSKIHCVIRMRVTFQKAKVMITTRPKCSRKLYDFIKDLMQMIPNAFYYPRGTSISIFFTMMLNY